ncbi:MAG: hypothetical protein MZW92_08305 [Comamonadaceae bacterium]|nr:hypothetical protein [Comamonadaceae bacterium]
MSSVISVPIPQAELRYLRREKAANPFAWSNPTYSANRDFNGPIDSSVKRFWFFEKTPGCRGSTPREVHEADGLLGRQPAAVGRVADRPVGEIPVGEVVARVAQHEDIGIEPRHEINPLLVGEQTRVQVDERPVRKPGRPPESIASRAG